MDFSEIFALVMPAESTTKRCCYGRDTSAYSTLKQGAKSITAGKLLKNQK